MTNLIGALFSVGLSSDHRVLTYKIYLAKITHECYYDVLWMYRLRHLTKGGRFQIS